MLPVRQEQEPFASLAEQEPLGNNAARHVSSKNERAKNQAWVPGVYVTFRKVFHQATVTLEEEKRFKAAFNRASTEGVVLDAIDMMWNEGVRYPTGLDVRMAIERVERRLASQRPLPQDTDHWDDPEWRGIPSCCPGSFDEIGFSHWWHHHANEQSKAEARRAASGLEVMARWVKAAER